MTEVDVTEGRSSELTMFLLAAEEDRRICEEIRKYLKPLTFHDEVLIRVLDDFEVETGEDVEAHRALLLEADVVLCLVSADFIDDAGIYRRGQQVIERYNRREIILVSVLVKFCMWELTPLAGVPVLPANHHPINDREAWETEDEAITAVVKEVHDSISDLVHLDLVDEVDVRDTTITAAEVKAATPTASAVDTEHGAGPVDEPPAEPDTPSSSAGASPVTWTVSVAEHEPVATDWRAGFYRQVLFRRLGASLVDAVLIFVVASIIVGTLESIVTGWSDEEDFTSVYLSFAMVFLLVMPFMESRWRGTPGKRLFGLQVTLDDGRSMSFARAFVRSAIRFVVYYAFFLVIPLVLQIWRYRKTKKMFHDEVTGTVISLR